MVGHERESMHHRKKMPSAGTEGNSEKKAVNRDNPILTQSAHEFQGASQTPAWTIADALDGAAFVLSVLAVIAVGGCL